MIAVLDKIRQAGGRVVVQDQAVRIEAPPGLLTDQDRQVLAQHRQDLLRLFAPAEPVVVDPYLDQERQAIQWVEALSPAEAERVVGTAVEEWDTLVRSDHQDLDQGQHREVDHVHVQHLDQDLDQWLRDNTVEPADCDKCGSLDRWQDLTGGWHCGKCDPPVVGLRVREQAAALRRRRYATRTG